jgi:hypothetical protein
MRAGIVSVLAVGLSLACSREHLPARPAEPTEKQAAELKPKAPETPQPAAAGPLPVQQGASPDAPGFPKEGWSKYSVTDEVPICLFVDEQTRWNKEQLEDVTEPPKLAADAPLTVGAYAPRCMNPECDELPSLQCSVKREGKLLTVTTRFYGYSKDGATCSKPCSVVSAGCNTPPLERGTYTLVHGRKHMEVRVPSTPKVFCLR